MNCENSPKPMSLKHQELFDTVAWGLRGKKGGPKMKVSLTMLLKTNVEKMSVLKSVTMLMKTSELYSFETMSMKSQEL
jgi:hypothetical protein